MSISEQSPFPEIAGALTRTVESASKDLRAMSDAAAGQPRAAGKWSVWARRRILRRTRLVLRGII